MGERGEEAAMDARIDRVTPDHGSGCNTWLVGDDEEVIVVDPGRDAEAVLTAASGREILAVICTHGHPEHVAAALEVAARDVAPVALHTPGHSPGWVSLYCEELGVVFSGDALLAAGPAPHAGAFPDFPGQLSAIGQELLTLPAGVRVLPGHGEEITVEAAGKRFDSWVAAGPQPGDRSA